MLGTLEEHIAGCTYQLITDAIDASQLVRFDQIITIFP